MERTGVPAAREWDDGTPGSRPELSVVVLGYRAGESLVGVLQALESTLGAEAIPHELVIVANYWPESPDETTAIAQKYARARPNVLVVAEEKQGAMGWDMRSGLAASEGEYLVVIDGDAQNRPDDVVNTYRALRDGPAQVVKGRRVRRHDGLYRRFVSLVYNSLFLLLFRTRGLWDINGKPKAMTRSAYEQLDLVSDDWFIDAEIVLKARARKLAVAELPVVFFRNDERASLVKPWAIVEFLRNMLRASLRRGHE